MKVKIDMKSVQITLTGDRNVVKESHIADLIVKGKSTFIIYDEYQEGLKISTRIKVSDDDTLVTMTKKGSVDTLMKFSEGKEHYSRYVVPYGTFDICTKAFKLEVDRNNDSLKNIRIEYDMEIKGLFSGENRLEIRIMKLN